MAKKKSARQKNTKNKTKTKTKRRSAKAAIRARVSAPARKSARKKNTGKARRKPRRAAQVGSIALVPSGHRAERGGQSGDNQRLSGVARADSQSVEELADEGQAFEAEVLSGVEEADDADAEVTTHEVPEDDVPSEYDGDR